MDEQAKDPDVQGRDGRREFAECMFVLGLMVERHDRELREVDPGATRD